MEKLLVVLVLLVSVIAQKERFGIQVHSWDDIGQWAAMIKKGVRSFKIDLHYVEDATFCDLKQQATPCLILNHDEPPPSVLFYTAYDALQYLSTHHTKQQMRIALCTKYYGDKCNSTYLDTMQAFFDTITDYRGNGALHNVEFVMDQALEPTEPCLKDRFLPWVSTLVPSRDPQEAISSDKGILGRFQIYNPSVGEINKVKYLELLANWDPPFGKFAKNKYPLQIWEPLDQGTIEKLAVYYNTLSIEKRLDFATNEDPIQKRLYLSPYEKDSKYKMIQLFKGEVEDYFLDRRKFLENEKNIHIYIGTKQKTEVVKGPHTLDSSAGHNYHVSTFSEDKNEGMIELERQVQDWEWKQDLNQFCFFWGIEHCYSLPALPNEGEELIAIDVSSLFILVGVTNQNNVYLTKGLTFKRWKLADKGTSASISSHDGYIVLLVGDSYCWNCAEFNLHQDKPLCSQTPHSIESVMSYSFGNSIYFDNFINDSEEPYITACNPHILHGALGTGYNPKVITRGRRATVIFKGVGEFCELREAKECGCSLPFSGLVMASFPMKVYPSN